jgi:hypothetical protein
MGFSISSLLSIGLAIVGWRQLNSAYTKEPTRRVIGQRLVGFGAMAAAVFLILQSEHMLL